MQAKRFGATALVCGVAVGLLAACGTRHVSRDISPDGVAAEVIFPAPERAVLKEGTFPNLDNLRQVGAGVSKEQLYHLLGRPHFREGYAGVREWDYLFHFRDAGGVTTCQYKAIFDRNYLAQSFHWQPQACAERLREPAANAAPAPTPSAAPRRFAISADALFAFARADAEDLQPAGRADIARIAGELRDPGDLRRVRVIGHTDRLGNESDNRALSQRRAETVRQLLIEQGVPAQRVVAEGRGAAEPVAGPCQAQQRAALIACLQPDRRVEIVAEVER
ncbi:OmpA family protein [Lysobacter sp. K5869]|uniref:OmpA family protein n=1 Tax=Lysobacter sp. K5869 TaxID=2820808 RepID=UPI001C062012|nr:OmpA family protein [Lysobacter sp. K5869]QWP75309.1 OmpA family protein [Lysobacter sp. K5869]